MTEWQVKKVGDIVDTQLGKMLNKGKQSGKHAKPYLRTDNVHWGRFDLSEIKEMDILPEEQDKYLATKGDLLMCEGGASGRTAIWNEDYDISFQNHVHRIRPKDLKEISPKYLFYYFEWFIKNGFASDLIKGVTISSLSQSGLRSIEVTYPPIDEQHKIVELLEDHLSRLEAALADVKQAKIKSAQFRRSILQAAFSGNLSPHRTSSVTSIPEDWAHLLIGSLCESVIKIDPINLGRDSFKYVDIGSLEPSSSSLENVVAIPKKDAPSRARQLLAVGDSIFATVRPYMKKVAYISQDFDGEIASTGFCVLRPNQEKLHARYLFYFLLSDNLLDQVLPLQRGVSYPAIRDNDLRNASIGLPPITEQQRIVTILEDHFSQLEPIVRMAEVMELQAAALRRSLLHSAFTGQLTKEVASV
jgi:type I restriction enzyme S subunit